MLQIDHVYEFLYSTIFKKFVIFSLPRGILPSVIKENINKFDIHIFNQSNNVLKIFFWDQEPISEQLSNPYIDLFVTEHPDCQLTALVTSEYSSIVNDIVQQQNLAKLYYFFHGFAALDWYRGFYALNYNKQVIKDYTYDYITFNRLVSNDRSYRCYFVSKLAEELLLEHGQVSFGLATEQASWQEEIADVNTKLSTKAIDHIKLHLPSTPLIIDNEKVLGSASADIPRSNYYLKIDSLWHVVTETVFYYDKLHLTEKIFKPIVMKQPFMLLGAVGNLAYLKSYGFKTFDGIIDESYDTIIDNDQRTEAVVAQIAWYCALSVEEKRSVIEAIAPIVEYNFHHFYGEFKHIITKELLDNCKTLFKDIGYDDNAIAYDDIYKVLTT